MKEIRHVAVDLTPILPGAENGGAKIFVLALLAQLRDSMPNVQFTLLTHVKSHDELAFMERDNMSRLQIVGPSLQTSLQSSLRPLASKLLAHLPTRWKRSMARVGFKVITAIKRSGSARKMLHELNVDLLFCPFTAPTYDEPGIPTVCTIYDLQYAVYPDFFSAADVAHRHHTFMAACQKAKRLTAISDYSREDAIKEGKLIPEHIRTIYLRMSQRILLCSEDPAGILQRFTLTPHQYFLYPANFWKHKNHEMLFTAFGMVCHEMKEMEIKLICTGAPDVRETWLKEAAIRMGLGDRIIFPGFISTEELGTLLRHSSGMIFPSLFEGFGLPVVEAMAAGVPVACSRSSSLPEVVGEAALLFHPGIPTDMANAMITLLKNKEQNEQLIKKGQDRAVFFSDTKRMAEEYWALFEDAVQDSLAN